MQMAQPSTRLPADVYDCIIENLCGDLSTLATCTLVCRGWLHRSRYCLFQDVYVHVDSTDKCNWLLTSPYHTTSGSKLITDYMRHVKITLPLKHLQLDEGDHGILQIALGRLTKIESLLLRTREGRNHSMDEAIAFHGLLQKSLVPILKSLKSLQTLKIGTFITFLDVEDLEQFIAGLPNIKRLETAAVGFGDNISHPQWTFIAPEIEMTDPDSPRIPCSLKDLVVETECLWHQCAVLFPVLRQQHHIRLSSLHLTIFAAGNWHAFDDEDQDITLQRLFFRSACVSQVEDLSLCYWDAISADSGLGHFDTSWGEEDIHPHYVDLSGMPRLKTFRSHMPVWWLPAILATVSSPQMHRVVISVELNMTMPWVSDYLTPSYMDWRTVDKHLARLSARSTAGQNNTLERTQKLALLIFFRVGPDFTPLRQSPVECRFVFTIFENLRAGGHHIGLRAHRRDNNTAEEFWWNDNAPDIVFTNSRLVLKAGC